MERNPSGSFPHVTNMEEEKKELEVTPEEEKTEENKDQKQEDSKKEEESKQDPKPEEKSQELVVADKKEKRKKRCKTTKKVLNIVGYVLVGIIFIFTFVALMYKFTGSDFYLFGKRYDVVLTDSMSVKNSEHLDFLEGTTQYQPMDLVLSDKIENDTVLNVKDVVLFDNPKIGTDMHRIVDIREDAGDTITISSCNKVNNNNLELLSLYDIGSNIKTNVIYFSKLTMTLYSITPYDNFYQYYLSDGISNETIESEEISPSWYKTTITLYKDKISGGSFTLAYAKVIDFESTCFIGNITLDSKYGEIKVNASTMKPLLGSNHTLETTFNQRYKYEIRGDKQAQSDGWFSKDQLYSKVTGSVPRIGAFIRFITSSWGLLCFLGLAIIFLIYDMVVNAAKNEDKIVLEEQSSIAIANSNDLASSNEEMRETVLQEESKDSNNQEDNSTTKPNENDEGKDSSDESENEEIIPDVHETSEEKEEEIKQPEIIPLENIDQNEVETSKNEETTSIDQVDTSNKKEDTTKKSPKKPRNTNKTKEVSKEEKKVVTPSKKKYLYNKSKKKSQK